MSPLYCNVQVKMIRCSVMIDIRQSLRAVLHCTLLSRCGMQGFCLLLLRYVHTAEFRDIGSVFVS